MFVTILSLYRHTVYRPSITLHMFEPIFALWTILELMFVWLVNYIIESIEIVGGEERFLSHLQGILYKSFNSLPLRLGNIHSQSTWQPLDAISFRFASNSLKSACKGHRPYSQGLQSSSGRGGWQAAISEFAGLWFRSLTFDTEPESQYLSFGWAMFTIFEYMYIWVAYVA